MGNHVFRSADDGMIYRFPVIFGTNISNSNVFSARKDDPESIQDAYDIDLQYFEISGETLPRRDADGIMWYQCRYRMPAACSKLEYLRFETANELVPPVRLKDFTLQ